MIIDEFFTISAVAWGKPAFFAVILSWPVQGKNTIILYLNYRQSRPFACDIFGHAYKFEEEKKVKSIILPVLFRKIFIAFQIILISMKEMERQKLSQI